MNAFVSTASAMISEHRGWAGALLGLLAFGEGLMVVGAFLPATILLFMAGGLIAAGLLDPGPILVWAIAGATLGDAVSYALGRRLGRRLLRQPILRRHARLLARTRLLMRRLGPASIYVGRFAGPMRAMAPLMAGLMAMPPRRFHTANILSSIAWVVAFVLPGYLAGRGLAPALRVDLSTLLAGVSLIALAAVGVVAVLRWKVALVRAATSLLKPRPLRLLAPIE